MLCSVLVFVIAIETTTPVEKHETKVRRVNRWCTRQKIKTSASAPHSAQRHRHMWREVHDACDKEGWFSRVVDTRTGIQRFWMQETQHVCVRATWVERLTRAREGFLCRRETLSEIAVDNTTIQRAWHARRDFRKGGQEEREGDAGREDGRRVGRDTAATKGWISSRHWNLANSRGVTRHTPAFIMRTRRFYRDPRFSPLFTAAAHNPLSSRQERTSGISSY